MNRDPSEIDTLAERIVSEIGNTAPATASKEAYAPRDVFLELIVMALGSLYAKVPMGSSLFDRATLKAVLAGLEDGEAGKMQNRTEDWIRLEGLVRALEGQKNYTLNRPSLAVLSTATAHGRIGELMEQLHHRYLEPGATPQLRSLTREMASYFMSRLGRA